MNLTDSESRIMRISGGGFEQCYNPQAGVDVESMLIVTQDVTQNLNDKQEVAPFLDTLKALPEELGSVSNLLADAGYYSEENVKRSVIDDIIPLICISRESHNQSLTERFSFQDAAVLEDPVEQMKNRLSTQEGRALYALRKCTIEPVFGIIKAVMGFRQFSFRGIKAVQGEWNLACIAFNLKRLHKLRQTT